jgi:hypothetical protein
MTSHEPSFRVLSLCTAPVLDETGSARLRAACAEVRDWDALANDAEAHGVEPLLLTHARDHGVDLPPAIETWLKVRFMQHAHAAAIRARAIAAILDVLEADGIHALVLKGAALAYLVYRAPALRPMRDIDLLVARRDAEPAWRSLHRAGFAPIGAYPGTLHHHLHALGQTIAGETITVEVHTQALAVAPFVPPLPYEEVAPRAQAFSCGGRTARTLGGEDMLWHIYAHAFLVNIIYPDSRLISIADLVAATEAWADTLDWDRLRRVYPRLVRSLPLVGDLVPWSPRVQRRLDAARHRAPRKPARTEWWVDLRYGNDGASRRLWNRLVTHPASVALAATHLARLKLRAYGPTP